MVVKYTNRTCDSCGARRPQPEMVRKEVYVETGKSNATISTNTWIGVMGGDKASGRAVKRAMYNNGERTYTRKKTIWVCRNCRAPSSNYVPPVPKKLSSNTNVPKLNGDYTHIVTTNTPIANAVTKSSSVLQRIVDRRPRSVLGWIVLVYAVGVVLAMIDSG